MAGARELGEVHSYPLEDSETFDDSGYVLSHDGGADNKVQKAPAGTAQTLVGVNYKSTEDQNGDVVFPDSGEIGVVTEGFMELRGDAETYTPFDAVYLSASNAGQVSQADSGQTRVGRVMEYVDYSGGSDSNDNPVLVKFDFN